MFRAFRPRLASSVGFIGLGNMGVRMAPNILAKDPSKQTSLFVYDVSTAPIKQLRETAEPRIVACNTPAEVAAECKVIITMLPNGKIVQNVYGGENGIFSKVQPGTLLIDCSTVDPQTPKDLHEAASKLSCRFVDAPVSGGVNAAAAGTLTFMVGAASDQDFESAKAVLSSMGRNIVSCGKVGSGTIVKICNNMILAQHMIAVSEAMLVGTKLGVDPKLLGSVINTSTGQCWTSVHYNPFPGVVPTAPAARNYEGGFGSSLMLKDISLAIDAAQQAQVDCRGAKNAKQMYANMVNANMGNLDFSGILKYIDAHQDPAAGTKA